MSGTAASRMWTVDVGTYPVAARADDVAGQYLLALGYAGVLSVP